MIITLLLLNNFSEAVENISSLQRFDFGKRELSEESKKVENKLLLI